MKYYKILGEDMTHYGVTYKEGLNTNDNEGGLFFTDAEHVLGFLGYGTLIAEVTIPENETMIQVDKQWKAHSIILSNIRKIDAEVMRELVEQGADIHADNDYALCWASHNGHLEVVKYLVEQGADIHANDDCTLRWAAEYGHLEMVKYLVEQGADIHTNNDWALRWAARNGHLEVFKYLVEQGTLHENNINLSNRAMYLWDDSIGNPEIIQYLKVNGILPRGEIQCFRQEDMFFYAKFDGNKLASIEKYDPASGKTTELSRFELLNNYPEISEKLNAFENRNNGRDVDNIEQER